MPEPTIILTGLAAAAAVTGMLAGILWWFYRLYRTEHFRWWAFAAAGGTASYGTAAVMMTVVKPPFLNDPLVLPLSILNQAIVFVAVIWLLAGTMILTRGRLPARFGLLLAGSAAIGAASSTASHLWLGELPGIYLSLSIRSALMAGALLWSARQIWRWSSAVERDSISPRFLAGAMAIWGVVQVHNTGYGAAGAAGWQLSYPFLGLLLLTGVVLSASAVAFVVVALQAERRKGAQVAAQAERAAAALDRREAWFKSLIEHSNDIITVLDQDGTIQYESPSITRVLGYEPEECIGKTAFEFLHPDDLASTFEALQRAVRTGQSVAHVFRFRHKDGTWIWIESVGKLLEDEPGQPSLVINSRDITDRQRLERQLIEAQKMESVGRLAGGVAHDFNNLLTIIRGNTDLVLNRLTREAESRGELEEVKGAAERAAQLTRQLLTFARRQTVAFRVVDANEQLALIERLLRRLIPATIELVTELLPGGGSVRVDPTQLEQVLLNLAVNARDAMPAGGRLTLRVVRRQRAPSSEVEPASSWIGIEVADTGVGMDETVRRHLFEPFFTTKPVGEGTGLGLATSYGIVRECGGSIEVETEPGAGSRFTVVLPEVVAEAAATLATSSLAPRSGTEVVLVAEDEPSVRRLAVSVLRALGYRVIEAADGEQAIRHVRANDPPVQLVVTDIVMPRLGGVALAALLRAERPELPILFTSGYTEQLIPSDLPSRSTFLSKPYSPDDLADQVRKLLDVEVVVG